MRDAQAVSPAAADIPWVHTPFEQPWWLEAVAPGRWGQVVIERNGAVEARLPYVRARRLGITVLTQAPLTRFLGPWLRPSEGRYATRLSREKELMAALIAGLPRFDAYHASFAPAVGNVLPFYWAGFDASVRYTYRLELTDPDALWAGLDKSVRSHIRRAGRELEVRDDLDLDTLLRLHRATMARHGRPEDCDDDLVRRLDQACAARQARSVVAAVDAKGRVHAASYVVRDDTTSYLLFSGADDELRASGATSLVRWEAIRRAAALSARFDFLGSMLEPIERVNRQFGGRQVPYYFVTRARPHVSLLLAARRALDTRRTTRRLRTADENP